MKMRKFAVVAVLVISSFAATNVAPSKSELEAMYDKAFREFDGNNFSEALKQLDAIDARQPDVAESQNLRGVILMREGIYDKAEAALHEALRIDPKFWNARFNLAEIPFLQKNWPEARRRFEELLASNAAELQGEASQLIQYKILLTYLLEGKENMVDSLLAKFELSPDTPAVHYANAAIALQKHDADGAKGWMTAAEKNFSPQLNKLFAESLYEVGWLEKQAGQTRAALELTSAADRAAKTKAFAHSRYEQAQQALAQRDLDAARKFVDEADAAEPNQAATLNLKGEILMEQKQFDEAEATFKKVLKIDPKFRQTQYNLAQLPFKKKDYAKARDRFEALFAQTPGGDKNQAAQLIKYKIYMTFLMEGKDSRAQKMMEQFQFTGDTPALYYAQAAWEFKHNNPTKASDWITSAKKIYSPALNDIFADSFYDLGWMQSAAASGSPAPSSETAAAVMSAQTESSPAIEPSPIPGTTVAAAKTGKSEAPASSSPITGMEATSSRAVASAAKASPAPAVAGSNGAIAAGTPARPEDLAASAPAMSPTVETPVTPAPVAASAAPVRTEEQAAASTSNEPAARPSAAPVVAAASATPATVLAPSRVREESTSSLGETLGRFVDPRGLLVVGLVVAAVALLLWVIVPEIRRRGVTLAMDHPQPAPAGAPSMPNGSGSASMQSAMTTRFFGGPRQVSLQLKASEPSLRRSPAPPTKAPQVNGDPNGPSAVAIPEIEHAAEPQFAAVPAAAQAIEPELESVGPVVEQGAMAANGETLSVAPQLSESAAPAAPAAWDIPVAPPVRWNEPETTTVTEWASPVVTSTPVEEPQPLTENNWAAPAVDRVDEFEPVGQGQPVPYQVPVSDIDSSTTEMTKPELEDTLRPTSADLAHDKAVAEPEALLQSIEQTTVEPVITEPLIVQPTIQVTMPEPVQTPPAPVIRTPTTGGGQQPASTMHTAVQLTFSFEIASMQLTPSFKMGALQLRPSSKIVTMRLAPSQQPQPAMNLQVTFEIARIQPTGGGLGTVRLTPSQQQRPQMSGSPSFTVAGLQLVSNFEAAPVQLTPSQSAAVLVTSAFQIATVEFSPSFEIASIVLNATSKQVGVQLPGAPASDGAPSFEISNLQLGATGDIGMMQINLLGQAPRR